MLKYNNANLNTMTANMWNVFSPKWLFHCY